MRNWKRSRMALSFETKQSAKERQVNDLTGPPSKKRKDHVGQNNTWDKEALRAEIEGK